ncbi:uncharacterized protein DUF3159 [Blastococcus colisei]|uniref:Uncharacterized protein DUF3159 n=1 Tax=Blastococcus colisei TaxID=1564162 RepID=A0A543PD02_9ACTN|nr:DUF3159 domain-containing protein [Blastococcus colisei]TQN41962.1 uncharacterized protein DUF3159 [Blastococcus colisei]
MCSSESGTGIRPGGRRVRRSTIPAIGGLFGVAEPTPHHPTPHDPLRARVLAVLGGGRGILDGGLPPLVFAVVNAVVGASAPRATALAMASAAASVTGGGIVAVRLVRRQPLRQALGGLAGLAIAVAFALQAGEARDFFLPAIYVDATYAIVFLGSVLIGRPLVGIAYGLLVDRRGPGAWTTPLRRTLTTATIGWSVVFGVRAGGQTVLYLADQPGLLAAGKLVLGWPLTILAALVTLAAIRAATAPSGGIQVTDGTGAA